MPRFTTDATTDALRAALIDDDLDDLTPELIEDIITAYPEAFNDLARRYLIRSWSNSFDVWDEAESRGYFTADHDD
jgi:predicted oxidoreductase (fatty acid repression mutant protein)